MVLQFGSSQPHSVRTELLTCAGLCIPGGLGGTLFSQMLVWVHISVQPFPLINNFNYFNSSYLNTLQNHVVLLCFRTTPPMHMCLGWMRSCQKFVPTASMCTMKPVPDRGGAAALKLTAFWYKLFPESMSRLLIWCCLFFSFSLSCHDNISTAPFISSGPGLHHQPLSLLRNVRESIHESVTLVS